MPLGRSTWVLLALDSFLPLPPCALSYSPCRCVTIVVCCGPAVAAAVAEVAGVQAVVQLSAQPLHIDMVVLLQALGLLSLAEAPGPVDHQAATGKSIDEADSGSDSRYGFVEVCEHAE